MFPKIQRATTRHVAQAQEKGKVEHSSYFSVRSLLDSSTESPNIRVSCIVSKKVVSNATERNKLKRRMREALRGVVIPSGVHLVYAKKSAVTLSFSEIREHLRTLFS